MAYAATNWVNNTSPAMSAANLNKLTDEIKAEAATAGITHSLPTWVNGSGTAITSNAPFNEMERVVKLLSTAKSLSYTVTAWQDGWVPARNATNLNKLEQQVVLTSQTAPPPGTTTPNPPQPPITTISNSSTQGINIGNSSQTNWQDYIIQNTGDSGIIMGPHPSDAPTTLTRFDMSGIGSLTNPIPGNAVHGVYCKRPFTTFTDFKVRMNLTQSTTVDSFTMRKRGITVNRFDINGHYDFCCSYFEEDSVSGTVTMMNGTGTSSSGHFMWTGSNPPYTPQNFILQKFVFQNVHATVPGSNPLWIGRDTSEIGYSGPGVQLIGCTINGSPVNSSHISNYPIISIT